MTSASDQLGYGLKWSLGAHLFLLVLILFRTFVFPPAHEPYIPALRVDIVGLPDILKKDLDKISKVNEKLKKTPELKELPKDEVKKKPEKVEKVKDEIALSKNKKEKMASALERIKALEQVETEENEVPEIKGNKVSKGSTLEGDAKETEATYFDELHSKLKANWELPVYLQRQNLAARVVIFIDSSGEVKSMKFIRSSGNSKFDEEVRKTIMRSQPFTAPPKDMVIRLSYSGVLLGFPL